MKWCFDKRVLLGLAVAAVGGLLLAPGYAATFLPILALLACPLSMVVMMRGTNRQAGAQQGGRCSTAPAEDAEVVRLQAELDALKAQLRDRRR